MRAYVCACARAYVCACVHVCARLRLYLRVRACVYECVCVCACVSVCGLWILRWQNANQGTVLPSWMGSFYVKIPRTFSTHVNYELLKILALKKPRGLVGTATACGVDGPGFEWGQRQEFYLFQNHPHRLWGYRNTCSIPWAFLPSGKAVGEWSWPLISK